MNATNTTKPAAGQSLFLFEFYTVGPNGESGRDINHAWVYAKNAVEAQSKLIANQGPRFNDVITIGQHSDIFPLVGSFRVNTPDANLFIIR